MKLSYEVFESIKNGELDLTEFSIWLNEYHKHAYTDGYEDGYKKCDGDWLEQGYIL